MNELTEQEKKQKYIDDVKEVWFNICLITVCITIIAGVFWGMYTFCNWLCNLEYFTSMAGGALIVVVSSPIVALICFLFYSTFKAIKYSKELKKITKK